MTIGLQGRNLTYTLKSISNIFRGQRTIDRGQIKVSFLPCVRKLLYFRVYVSLMRNIDLNHILKIFRSITEKNPPSLSIVLCQLSIFLFSSHKNY